jgi:hypothetical protein
MRELKENELRELNGGARKIDGGADKEEWIKWAVVTAGALAVGAPFTPAAAGATLVYTLWSMPVGESENSTAQQGDVYAAQSAQLAN